MLSFEPDRSHAEPVGKQGGSGPPKLMQGGKRDNPPKRERGAACGQKQQMFITGTNPNVHKQRCGTLEGYRLMKRYQHTVSQPPVSCQQNIDVR